MSVKGMDTLQTTSCESVPKKVMTSKKICKSTNFRNNSHSVRILEDLQSQCKNEFLCDVKLQAADDKFVNGHKNVLIAASPYFRAMFETYESNIFQIKYLDYTILKQLVDYIYTGEILITEENVQALLPASSTLLLNYVNDACAKFLQAQLDPSNCIGTKAIADLHNCVELQLSSEAFIKRQFVKVVKCDEFLYLPYSAVVKLLSSNDLTVPFEEKVYECVLNWVNHNLGQRIKCLAGLMEHVRLPLASIQYVNKVSEEPLIKNNSKCLIYVIEALQFHLHKLNPDITIPLTIRCSPREASGLQKILILSWNHTTQKSCIHWYDPITNKWEIKPEMTKFRYFSGILIMQDQFLFAVGGVYVSCSKNSGYAETLDLTLQSPNWLPTVDMFVSRRNLGVAALDNCIYAVGGAGEDGKTLNSVEVFDFLHKHWKMVSSMTIERRDLGIGVLNNCIYAVGGSDDSGHLKSVEYYVPSLHTWKPVAEMSICRYGLGVGVLDGKIYAIGGISNGVGELKSVEAYNPSDDAWTPVANMHRSRSYAGIVVVDGLLHVMGGQNRMSYEIYDPTSNTWKIFDIDSNTIGNIHAAAVLNKQ